MPSSMFVYNHQPAASITHILRFMLLLCLPVFSFAQVKAGRKLSLLNGKVEISIPSEITEMSDETWKKKYGSAKKPFLALSDKRLEVSLIGHQTGQEWEDAQMAEYIQFRLENFKNNRIEAKILDHGIKDINGKKIGYIKFEAKASDTQIFNYYFFVVLDGNILHFSFNTPEKLKTQWEKTADNIVESLSVK